MMFDSNIYFICLGLLGAGGLIGAVAFKLLGMTCGIIGIFFSVLTTEISYLSGDQFVIKYFGQMEILIPTLIFAGITALSGAMWYKDLD